MHRVHRACMKSFVNCPVCHVEFRKLKKVQVVEDIISEGNAISFGLDQLNALAVSQPAQPETQTSPISLLADLINSTPEYIKTKRQEVKDQLSLDIAKAVEKARAATHPPDFTTVKYDSSIPEKVINELIAELKKMGVSILLSYEGKFPAFHVFLNKTNR